MASTFSDGASASSIRTELNNRAAEINANNRKGGGVISDIAPGETVQAGEIVRLDAGTEKWVLASAGVEGSAVGLLGVAQEIGTTDTTPFEVAINTTHTTTGLTVGAEYVLSATAGGMVASSSAPSSTGNVIRSLGFAKSATELIFNPSSTYIVLS